MHSPTCVSAVVCVARKLHPCLSYSRRRDRINLVLLHSYYKGGGVGKECLNVENDPASNLVAWAVSFFHNWMQCQSEPL